MADNRLRLAVATPNAEGSVLAIAGAAARRGALTRFYTTMYGPRLARHVPRRIRGRFEPELGRRTFPDVPSELITSMSAAPELLRMAASRLPRTQPVASRAMYEGALRFDSAVARRLTPAECEAIVAMFASQATMQAARRRGISGVLNFVNGHPAEHNRLLTELGGLREGHHELVPPRIHNAVEQALARADLVLVPSELVARQLRAAGVPDEKVSLQRYGVDLARFAVDRAAAIEERRGRRRRLKCLFVGQIGHRKGVPILVEAARRLADRPIAFELVGPLVSPEVLRNAPGNVSYVGRQAHAGIAKVMREADVFLLPSLEDAYALAVMEAMASGLPVVVTDRNGASELVDEGSGFVVPAGDAAAIVAVLERLVDEPELGLRVGMAARKRIEAHSWTDYGDRVLDTISERVAGRADRAPA